MHWWPDPAEGTDEVTGRRGVRRGFGAVGENPDVRLGHAAGWVELGPGITNHTFTLSGWLLQSLRPSVATRHVIVAQNSGPGTRWSLIGRHWSTEVEFLPESSSSVETGGVMADHLSADWHAFAIRAAPGQVELWLDGTLVKARPATWTHSPAPGLLTVGNTSLGNSPWDGDLRDLRLHDRLISDAEIRSLAALPRSQRRVPVSAPDPVPVMSVVPGAANPAHYSLRHFTTDHGLLSSKIQCLLQASNGALWLGAEEGLARFDGRSFWTADETTPGFSITGPDVIALGEARFGTIWMGMFHGLLSLRGNQWQIHTNVGPARFLRRILPAEDGTVWLAGHREVVPRGSIQLRRFDPVADRLPVDVAVPGQIRDLHLAADGLWIGTVDPAALWRFHESTGSVEMMAHLAATGEVTNPVEYPPQPCLRLAHGLGGNGVQAEVWQEADGSFQWAQIRLGTNGPALTWRRTRRADWRMVETGSGGSVWDWVPAPRGLLQRDGGEWKRLALGDAGSEATVTALASNAEGGVWAATEGDGLWLVQPRRVKMLTPQEGWGSEEVASLTRLRDGRLLVGGASSTLARIDPRFLVPPEISPVRNAGGPATEQPDGTVLQAVTGYGSHLARGLEPHRKEYGFMADGRVINWQRISQLLAPADGSVWIVDERGVFQIPQWPELPESSGSAQLAPPAYSVFLDDLPKHVSLYGLAEAPDGAVWTGSVGAGLFRIFRGRVENFRDPSLLPENPCVPLGFAADGTLWLGSEGGLGLWRHGQYRWVRPTDGLPESVVSDVEEAEGHLWFAG
ncbi:MAG: hypothetical protein KIT22_10370, partial [Verrucomicrobiae bacterium]|nr:hypothetical protein [Verrucomicrobiae bacterium]